MTCVMSARSSPRAATSVATSVDACPLSNRRSARSRWPWLRSPCSATASTWWKASFLTSRSAPRRRSHEHEREPAISAEELREGRDLVVRLHREEAVLDLALAPRARWAPPRSGRGRSCTRAASSPTVESSVAEKNIVCLAFGTWRTMRSTWGLKPMSSIRSASSRTRIFTPSSAIAWRSSRSLRRPGVATTTCAVRARFAWACSGTPP